MPPAVLSAVTVIVPVAFTLSHPYQRGIKCRSRTLPVQKVVPDIVISFDDQDALTHDEVNMVLNFLPVASSSKHGLYSLMPC